jgi:hypothetical protein
LKLRGVLDPTAYDLLLVLYKDRLVRVLEDNVVLRIAFAELLLDFFLQIVFLVLCLPISERYAQRVKERAVGINAGLLQCGIFYSGMKIRSRDLPQSLSSVLNASRTTDSRVVPETRRNVCNSLR